MTARRISSLKSMPRAAAAKQARRPGRRPLSDLDGPLSHLLMAKTKAEAALERAKMNLDCFMGAVALITEKANGRSVTAPAPPQVLDWVKRIQERSGAARVQRSD